MPVHNSFVHISYIGQGTGLGHNETGPPVCGQICDMPEDDMDTTG